ncbi:MAG: GAF domain-containing protein [Limnothrix sp. CACIAM 69d]|nr:MAG: GAF domain-containing protein [Limnothrix sp. CACIAM 69d]
MLTDCQLSGYQFIEEIYQGSRTAVYRGMQLQSQQPVVIKILRSTYPSFEELLQFRNQYTISQALDMPGLVRSYALAAYGNSYALIMEDFGGISLREYAQNQPLSLYEILSIALQLSVILDYLHQQKVIHKDIKPANILIHPSSGKIKLTDFSIASLLPREAQCLQSPTSLEGTLAYLAPEQTGRMNRGIDYRSDFYALGVSLYELLTGQLPFPTTDPMELVHCHLARQPIAPSALSSEIPPVVSAIVLKLMAKNAEDRYQSARGLSHDLQICLDQLQAQEAISDFELGIRDLSDHFLIPEKLYGRESEVKTLLDAFERVQEGKTELMLVAGFSGIGKTAVINEIHKPITRQKGYFIKGKFDQFNRNIPLSAFVQAFQSLIGQLLSESDQKLQDWKSRILEALGNQAQVLLEVIPGLERIIGSQPPAPELSGTAAQNRFKLLFQKFIQVFTITEHPLVIFLDDLQWADPASLQLLKVLMEDQGYLLILGAYRDNEVAAAHPLILTLQELQKSQATVNTITLQPLTIQHLNHLMVDTFHCLPDLALPLTKLIYQKTQGNPFFTTQFLKTLHEEGYITFNASHCHWECDLAQINILALADDVVEFMAVQLQKLPTATQQSLQLAACIGNQFDLETLAVIAEQSLMEAAAALWRSLQEGMIVPVNQAYKLFQASVTAQGDRTYDLNPTYRFLHDRIQQAAYSLIAETERPALHYRIGRLLVQHFTHSDQEDRIFEIVNHLNLGRHLITNDFDRRELVGLNLQAGRKAITSAAYGAALDYLNQGIDLLPNDAWQQDYDLTLELHQQRLEAAYFNTEFEQLKTWGEVVLQHSTSVLDQIKVYETRMLVLQAQSEFAQVIELGLQVLQQLGIEFPLQPTPAEIDAAYERSRQAWEAQEPLGLLDLPPMEDPKLLAAMQILTNLSHSACMAAPALLPLLIFKQIDLSIHHGNCAVSVVSYADYGMVLCGIMNDILAGYQFAQLSLALLEKLQANAFKSRVYLVVNTFARHWCEPLQEVTPSLLEGCRSGLESGDWECVALNLFTYANHQYWSGRELLGLAEELLSHEIVIEQVKQQAALRAHQSYRQAVLNLLGQSTVPSRLQGDVFDLEQLAPSLKVGNDRASLFSGYLHQIFLYYLFEEHEAATALIPRVQEYQDAGIGFFLMSTWVFYQALIQLQQYPLATSSEQVKIRNLVQGAQDRLHQWAVYAPENQAHRWQLVAAEVNRVLGQKTEAIETYDCAIADAKKSGFSHEEALANELAAKFYLQWGKEKVAAGYMQEAYYGYARWGAKAKTADLERRYPQLLSPILRAPIPAFNPLETLAAATIPPALRTSAIHNSPGQVSGTPSSSSSDVNEMLDLAAVIRTSQTLAGTIQLDDLLRQLTQIVLQCSGGDRCALVVAGGEGDWQVRAIARPESVEVCTEPLETCPILPVQLVQYVKNTETTVVIDQGQTSLPITDRYLIQTAPKSVLCLPILSQSQLVAILYLENSVVANVFTNDRLLVLNFLCAQAAISLENSRLYHQAQTYAHQLEQSQLQVVQSEKMASLGNLVAGVAHEINNPIGFLNGSIQNLQDSIGDLMSHLGLYQQYYPNPEPAIASHAEAIELDFLNEDLPTLLQSMQLATDRIKGISNSLRTFSRADTQYKIQAHLHEGIDSTLLILKYRLKANEYRPAIQVIQDYGNLPPIDCFPGQLNQVFMNLLANAIDMFDELAQGASFEHWVAHPQQITICTQVVDQQVQIAIRDNGKGMSEAVRLNIFDHAFTTKAVGKGTGLGLAIARQIVVDKHGGSLEARSELGQGAEFLISLPIHGD